MSFLTFMLCVAPFLVAITDLNMGGACDVEALFALSTEVDDKTLAEATSGPSTSKDVKPRTPSKA